MTQLLTLDVVADRLGMSRAALKRRLQRGTIDIEVLRIGNGKHPALRIRECDLEEMIGKAS